MAERRTQRWWRKQYVASHYAKRKVAPGLIRSQMETKRFTVTTLTRAVNLELARTSGEDRKVSRQAISLIVNDRMDACKPDLAEALESVLEVPNLLFSLFPKSSGKRETANLKAAV